MKVTGDKLKKISILIHKCIKDVTVAQLTVDMINDFNGTPQEAADEIYNYLFKFYNPSAESVAISYIPTKAELLVLRSTVIQTLQ